jgi:hypothetical protein
LQLINQSTSPNELNTTLTPHRIIHGDACFAYFNKIWGIPKGRADSVIDIFFDMLDTPFKTARTVTPSKGKYHDRSV